MAAAAAITREILGVIYVLLSVSPHARPSHNLKKIPEAILSKSCGKLALVLSEVLQTDSNKSVGLNPGGNRATGTSVHHSRLSERGGAIPGTGRRSLMTNIGDNYVNSDYVESRMDELTREFIESVDSLPTYRPSIGCVIPAYNEADSIAAVLESLLAQTRLPDIIHVIVNNSSDDTVKIASTYAGPHIREIDGREQFTEIYVHDIGKNRDKKVGALNYGFTLVEGDVRPAIEEFPAAHAEHRSRALRDLDEAGDVLERMVTSSG